MFFEASFPSDSMVFSLALLILSPHVLRGFFSFRLDGVLAYSPSNIVSPRSSWVPSFPSDSIVFSLIAVSYTHLDVYKRQF